MGAPVHEFTHGSYDELALSRMLDEEGFVDAFSGCMNLLGTCFVESPKQESFRRSFATIASMVSRDEWPFGDEEGLAQARAAFERASLEDDEASQVREYTRLFRGPAKLPAPPWGSVYMDRDQVMYGWTWVELRNWLRACRLRGTYAENDPEDHFGRMLALAGTVAYHRPELLGEFLADHLLCWTDRFFTLIEPAAGTATYQALIILARITLADVADWAEIVPARRRMYR